MREVEIDLEPLFTELKQHMIPSDIEELQSIFTKIETEIADSRQRFTGGQ
jgi:hypothetical protein